METLNLKTLMQDSFDTLKDNFKVLAQLAILFILIPQDILSIAEIISPVTDVRWSNPYHLAYLAWEILTIFTSMFFSLTVVYVLVKKDNRTLEAVLRGSLAYLGKYIVLSIILAVLLLILFLLLIIPGIIFSIFWTFAYYILVDQNKSAWESMKKSKAMVKGRWWQIFGYSIVIMLIALAAMLVLIVTAVIPLFVAEYLGGSVKILIDSLYSILFLTAYALIILYVYTFVSRMYIALKDTKKKKSQKA